MLSEQYSARLLQHVDVVDPEFKKNLLSFYNGVCLRDHDDSPRTEEQFSQYLSRTTLDPNHRTVLTHMMSGDICGFVAGYFAEGFGQENFALREPVPEGSYFYIYGLGSSAKNFTVIMNMINVLLCDVQTDYLLSLVDHNTDIYKRQIYQRRGWIEVMSDLEIAKNSSYFYIPFEQARK